MPRSERDRSPASRRSPSHSSRTSRPTSPPRRSSPRRSSPHRSSLSRRSSRMSRTSSPTRSPSRSLQPSRDSSPSRRYSSLPRSSPPPGRSSSPSREDYSQLGVRRRSSFVDDDDEDEPAQQPKKKRSKDEKPASATQPGRGIRRLADLFHEFDVLIVRAKLRAAESGYSMASSFFLRCLYEDEEGDDDHPEVGYLKGPLLILTYRNIFTAPSSATDVNFVSEPKTRRRDVASLLHLAGQVTPRSIAYAATQLLFALNTSRDWKAKHAGFHYPSFYNFVVDFFEVIKDQITRDKVNDLLQWWNSQIFPPTSDTSIDLTCAAALSSEQRLQESRARRVQEEADHACTEAEQALNEAERAFAEAERARMEAERA